MLAKLSDVSIFVFNPFQIKRIAKAEAEAAKIKVQCEIEAGDMLLRAERRRDAEEIRYQQNMECVFRPCGTPIPGDAGHHSD